MVLRFLKLQEPNYNWFNKQLAKQGALIAVDQVIDLGLLYGEAPFGNGGKQFYSYWQQVQIEIEKL